MKTKQWIGTVFVFCLILSGCINNRGVVERPAFMARNADALEINKIELSDTAAVLYIKAFHSPKSWIKIDSNSFLKDNLGKQYPILTTKGIVLGKEFTMPDSGETEFTMIFPPVASNAAFVDFSEGDFKGAWKIWGIQITKTPLKVSLPKELKQVAIDKNAVLPPVEFKTGKARLEGQILNFQSGMPATISVSANNPFQYPPADIAFPVDEKGKFSGEIDAYFVHPVTVSWMNSRIQCFIASGDTTSLVLNPAEISRRESRLLGSNPSLGEPVYYSGYLASLSKELANIQSVFSLRHIDSYESYISFLQSIKTKGPEELKAFFLDEYRTKKAALDTLNVSPACKQILLCRTDLFYANEIINATSWIDRVYIYNNQLEDNREAVNKYYANRKFNLPDDFYTVIKDFPMLSDSRIVYAQEAAEYVYQWQMSHLQPVLSKALGTDQGIIFDLIKVTGLNDNIKNFKPIEEEQIKQLPVGYQEFIRNRNKELSQLIEANKSKTGFTENDIAKVADKDVFPFIISKFKGKHILLDFWATWCGPCRMANEELKPVKAELANKDIVYVYVAGENSPLETWKNMIPDLHGEHFRLSAKQWEYIGKTFNIHGVPTYFFIDREGTIKEMQVGYPGVKSMKEKLLQLLKE